jgi:transposase
VIIKTLNDHEYFVSYIRYITRNEKTYAYEVTALWDKELKQSRSKTVYLGRVDPETKNISKLTKKNPEQEKLILDFGDGYFLLEYIKNFEFSNIFIDKIFKKIPAILPLMIYRLCNQSAMYNCENWLDGNVLNLLCKNGELSSQRISDMLKILGDEQTQRDFFTDYLQLLDGSDNSVIIDATSLPNQINIDFNAWGRSDGKIDTQFKLLCVVDQVKKIPLFYRFLPGNLSDVSTLQTTILELAAMGVKNSFVLLDAGYFSEKNIIELYNKEIGFLTRMPSSRIIYKEIILKKIRGIEHLKNTKILNERTFFVKKIKIDLYGKKAYAYVVLDPERKAKELKELMQKYCLNNLDHSDDNTKLEFGACGIMILVSSKSIHENEIVSAYYQRQAIEQIFGFSKDDLGLLPIRNHNEPTVKGYLFFQFLLLIIYIKIRENIRDFGTVEQMLMTLRKLKCKVFGNQIIPAEPIKSVREIFKQFQILVPKNLGI